MKSTPKTPKLRRFAAALAVMFALIVAALTPALVVSLVLTQDSVKQIESTEQAATIDAIDIDQNGTVMHTVSPPQDSPHVFEIDHFINVLDDSDEIRLTISDRGTETRLSDEPTEDECNFTLHLRDSDEFDGETRKTGTYTGYIRIRGDEMRDPAGNHDSICGIVIKRDDESR